MFKVIKHQNKDEWDQIVNNSDLTDVYHTWGYLNGYYLNGDGDPLLFYFKTDTTEIINVVIKRDIHADKRFSEVLKPGRYFDFISPYGYGGTLIQSSNDSDINNYFEEYNNYCIKNKIVSEFVRFHPIKNNFDLINNEYDIITLGETIALDLSSEDIVWSNIQSRMRNKIRKANKDGVEIYFSNDRALLDTFIDIYEETMNKNNADSYYFFNREYYESIVNDLKYNFLFCYAKKDGEIISIAIILLGNQILHYHLSGTRQSFNNLAPNNNVLLNTALWGSLNGYKLFHLGGGLGSSTDELLNYKKKFNKNSNLRFSIGKKIFNQEMYNELVKIRNFESQKSFFPEYRA
ncbi:GNAT family N-acetyltransferase [Macrococcus capreoli]|uniref:GNAT family N-acetyltransferase n=1 Tax=Macrococcus capreoli TaxID=2982690 RepID=UPI0021D5B09B|nr:GNAT family N-acetyltransferase [Macrococcus sp. TMW 2.2395]MCU7557552.1 GNAT family N-acetyltransferase [Macrococcus sp. TMW 2.2395]